MSTKIQKSSGMDKFDAWMPNKGSFIHDDYYVSNEKHAFHLKSAYGWRSGCRKGFSMGIQKKMYRASPLGIMVDSQYIGKSDE